MNRNRHDAQRADAQMIEVVDRLLAGSVLAQAQIDNLLTLVDFLAKSLGLRELDGLSIRDWFQKEKGDQVERILLHFEDQNPGAAAFLQSLIDRNHLIE
jgi:hypothetical protein